jgi:uncharacterized protein Yka (UPF0111/DUF47 family)
MARFSLVPRNTTFDDAFQSIGDVAWRTATALCEMIDGYPSTTHMVGQIKELEHEGDRILRFIVKELVDSFVTPYDREDIYELAQAIDDIVDHIDEGVALFDIYQVTQVPTFARKQAELLQRATVELMAALRTLDSPSETVHHWNAIHAIEDLGDAAFRDGVKEVFAACYHEPAKIICWRDIYRQFEDAINACERAATVLEAVGLKHG